MVKIQTSLLAVTLATGSALAFSNDYQRRSEVDQVQQPVHSHLRFGLACAGRTNLHPRDFVDEEDLFVRDDAFDDLEAREPGKYSALFKWGSKIAKHKHTKNAMRAVDFGSQAYNTFHGRDLEDNEDLFVRDLDDFDDLEAREPGKFAAAGSLFKWGSKIAKHKNTKNAFRAVDVGSQVYNTFHGRDFEDNEDLFERDLDAFDDLEAREPGKFAAAGSLFKWGSKIAKHKNTKNAFRAVDVGSQVYNTFHGRDLEDNDDLFVRDLDAFDDLEAREPGKFAAAGAAFKWGSKVASHKNTKNALNAVEVGTQVYSAFHGRDFEDNEDLFERDLDAEEFFGREYDLLD